jgi:vitamin B12 transporter
MAPARVSTCLAAILLAAASAHARRATAQEPYEGRVDGGASHGAKRGDPFAPDTQRRLTGEELAERGAQNLADALELVPELQLRDGGRGEVRVEVRGAKQRAVMILIDGVPIDEPYYGSFDLASIPVTDIVEIRVSLAPASPLDGPGGPGGVIEVITLAAAGPRRVSAKAQATSAPYAHGAVTGRSEIFREVSARVSAGGTMGWRELDTMMPGAQPGVLEERTIQENRRAAQAALRLERKAPIGTFAADLNVQHRSFLVPPNEDAVGQVLVVHGEDTARVALTGQTLARGWRLAGTGYLQVLSREQDRYSDASLSMIEITENLSANRSGVDLRADRGFGAWEVGMAARLHSEQASVAGSDSQVTDGRSTMSEAAAGLHVKAGDADVQASAGVAVPVDGDFAPWPEGKLQISWAPAPALELRAIGARKGRLPTLRERFAPQNGNPDLGPEMVLFGELGVTLRPARAVEASFAGYVRNTDGLIQLDQTRTMQENRDEQNVRGLEASLDLNRAGRIGGGAAWSFADASADDPLQEPDNLPRHKLEAWAQARVTRRAGVTARVRHVGDRTDHDQPLGSYTTVDASAWAHLAALRAALRIENLSDLHYLERDGVYAPGRTFILSLEGTWE